MARPRKPLVIGLLGGIASGKSRVAALLAEAGASVLDADALARAALDEPEVVAALRSRHGDSILDADRRAIDRAALARATFGRPEHLSHLESLVHPRVRERLLAALGELTAARVPAIVLDVPLLLENGALARRCDLLLFVECSAPKRRKRAMAARGWDEHEIERRESHQLPLSEKRRRADVVLRNEGSDAELRRTVGEWLARAGGFAGLARGAGESGNGDVGSERRPKGRSGR